MGRHCILDIYNIENTTNLEPEKIIVMMDTIIDICSFTVVEKVQHLFQPIGLTAVYILSESHIIVHTFPEKGVCNIDIFCCRKDIGFETVVEFLRNMFPLAKIEQKIISR